MIVFLILLMITAVYRMDFSSFHHDYLGIEQSAAVKGIFAIVIFLSHAKGYLTLGNGIGDILFDKVMRGIGQTMVVMFFFYSGYGVMESYRKKKDYEKKFFRNRILKTLIHFDLAVVLYFLLNIAISKEYPLVVMLLSFTGWTAVGNSNWFICVILLLYMLTLAAFFIGRKLKKDDAAAYLTLAMSAVLWLVLASAGKPEHWYNTLLCYPAGMLWSCYKKQIDEFMENSRKYWLVSVLLLGICLVCWKLRRNTVIYSILSLAVSMIIAVLTMKVKLCNQYLLLAGKYSFSIYILQRIPMIILSYLGISNPFVFTYIAFISVCILAYGFEKVLKRIDAFLF